jgi:molybdate transport system substrate-binding protein
MRRRSILAGFACSLLLLAACSKGSSGSNSSAGPATLTVLGAASLTDAFTTIGKQFEGGHDGVTVRFSFGPSDGLAQQIQGGAPADVFASASPTWMDAVAKDPGVADRADFAKNRLTIITTKDNPAHITSVQDLGKPGVKLVLAAEGVPAGDYGRQVLDNAGISDQALKNVVSNAVDVKGVVQTVTSGDADAGIVYVTDVTPDVASQVKVVAIPDSVNVIATYPIGVVTGSSQSDLAKQFVRFVEGPGQSVLKADGFLPAT